MDSKLELSFEQLYHILSEVVGKELIHSSVSLTFIFNVTDELTKYGWAERIKEADRTVPWTIGDVYRIRFHDTIHETLFLLKYGPQLK